MTAFESLVSFDIKSAFAFMPAVKRRKPLDAPPRLSFTGQKLRARGFSRHKSVQEKLRIFSEPSDRACLAVPFLS
jgi:hypothetical protein